MDRFARLAPMWAVLLLVGSAAALPAGALAKNKVVYPPGNSGVSQYAEDLPTAHGDKLTSSIVLPAQSVSGQASSANLKKLARDGSDGAAAAALALATAEASNSRASGANTKVPQAPATSVIRALTGSTGGGGLGALLPVLLIAALVIFSAVGILQRRRPT